MRIAAGSLPFLGSDGASVGATKGTTTLRTTSGIPRSDHISSDMARRFVAQLLGMGKAMVESSSTKSKRSTSASRSSGSRREQCLRKGNLADWQRECCEQIGAATRRVRDDPRKEEGKRTLPLKAHCAAALGYRDSRARLRGADCGSLGISRFFSSFQLPHRFHSLSRHLVESVCVLLGAFCNTDSKHATVMRANMTICTRFLHFPDYNNVEKRDIEYREV